MSAFVVDTKVMNRVVGVICAGSRYGQIVRRFGDIETNTSDAPTLIGRLLFSLNIEAVMQRYPDTQDSPENMPGVDGCMAYPGSYRFPGRPPGKKTSNELIDGYKALRCLIYQCSEGDADQSATYKALTDAAADVAHEIVSRTAEYEKSGW
jgi:hypothetical protein